MDLHFTKHFSGRGYKIYKATENLNAGLIQKKYFKSVIYVGCNSHYQSGLIKSFSIDQLYSTVLG